MPAIGATCRKKRGIVDRRGRIPDMVMISEDEVALPRFGMPAGGADAMGTSIGNRSPTTHGRPRSSHDIDPMTEAAECDTNRSA
jgi:hypothetical protein